MKTLPTLTIEEQEYFWSFVNILDTIDCWNWTGYILESGYGHTVFASR